RAQGLVRSGRRAHFPVALADDRPDRGHPWREGAPRQAVLPARAEGRGREDERAEAHRLRSYARSLVVGFRLSMSKPRASRSLENVVRRLGFVHVAGVDEVGRGCLAGPVVAGAVVLNPDCYVAGIADSKVLTALDRERLFGRIVRTAVAWSVAIVEPAEIDR